MNEILYEGKSKIISSCQHADRYILKFKDTMTAQNGEKRDEIKGKGILNASISNFIFSYLEKNGIQTHLLDVLDESTIMVKKAEIIMVEVIVRNVAAGSFSKKFDVREGSNLQNTVVEFSLKSDKLGDPMINTSQITALSIATKQEIKQMTRLALKINALLSKLFLKINLKLIDFKLEFGRCGTDIILCDEISPDSCRLWDVASCKKMDKDRFRMNLGNVLESYNEVFERLTKC